MGIMQCPHVVVIIVTPIRALILLMAQMKMETAMAHMWQVRQSFCY